MPRTTINCPNCRQPVTAEIQQVFDVGVNPQAKQMLLSGAANMVVCPHCGFQGPLATPFVYHDPEKELLLTFTPPEMNLPPNERERIIGQLINQVVENLPPEKRKGYLFSPQPALTMQGLMERILQADGITKEMLQAQQDRVNLIQRMLEMSDDVLTEVAKQNDELIDEQFFTLLSTLAQASQAGGDRETFQSLAELQKKLLPITTFGKEVEQQSKDMEAAVKRLQDLGNDFTRDDLLDLLIDVSENAVQLSVIVSMARPGLDYEFFSLLTERISAADDETANKLNKLREELSEMTRRVDEQITARQEQSRRNLEALLGAPDIRQATLQNLPAIDEFFLQVLEQEMATAEQAGNQDRLNKMQQIIAAIQEASTPPGAEMLQKLIEAPDDETVDQLMKENQESIDQEFLDLLTNVMMQVQDSDDTETADRVRSIYRKAVRASMQAGMQAE
ncbi:MAG: hypothetical protein JXB38_15220 [Anaerolineales bacterium]|nr:hypothetical protein [Anaerolineales bacterium]